MKMTKMSLVAALLVGSSLFAVDVKVDGNAQLFYDTHGGSPDLFDKDHSAADAGFNLNISSDLIKSDLVNVSAGAGYTVLSTLGLENNLVSGVWGGAHGATAGTGASYGQTVGTTALGGAKVENANWFNEAWVAATTGNTTAKLGRMELDTPLAFTEKWSIEKNTFEAAVLINQDIPDTTVVAAYVGNGNGTETFGQSNTNTVASLGLAVGPLVNQDGKFTTYGTDGAYALGVINNSFKPVTAQLWYYDVSKLAQAYWIQADLDAAELGVDGVTAGAQYVSMSLDASGSTENTAFAIMAGYAMKDMFAAKLAYSAQSDSGSLTNNAFNTATSAGTAQTKLYTEAWWNYGQVTKKGAKAINLTVEAPVEGIADLGLYITNVDNVAANSDLTEITLTASRSFGPLDTSLAYINTAIDGSDDIRQIQAYLTLNF